MGYFFKETQSGVCSEGLTLIRINEGFPNLIYFINHSVSTPQVCLTFRCCFPACLSLTSITSSCCREYNLSPATMVTVPSK